MAPANALWDFVERCNAAATAADVGAAFLGEMTKIGFAHVALCSHVDPVNPPPGAVAIFRYPQHWLDHFSAEGYQRFDPVFMAAVRRATPFQWSDPEFVAALDETQRRVLNEGAEVGVADGFTIPIRGPNALPASCSLVPGESGVDPLHYRLAHTMAVLAHESAHRLHAAPIAQETPSLSERERQCLTLAARGKSDWAISSILGISERHVQRTFEITRRRMGVATRTQAIVRALYAGQISMYDALD